MASMVYNCRVYDITLDIDVWLSLNHVKYIGMKRALAVNNIEAKYCQNIIWINAFMTTATMRIIIWYGIIFILEDKS